MDLTKFLGQDSQEQSAQRLSKEEYAAQKKQEREEIWGMIDGKAQEVFQNGDSLKGFLDFMGQCKPQRTDNLFLHLHFLVLDHFFQLPYKHHNPFVCLDTL